MNTKTKSMTVPDIGNLLGAITDKRDKGELGKTERQHVAPVKTELQENVETVKSENIKTLKRKKAETDKREKEGVRTPGRPTTKSEEIAYARIGAVIPKLLRTKAGDALNHEIFKTPEGHVIKTLDDLVTLALSRLLSD